MKRLQQKYIDILEEHNFRIYESTNGKGEYYYEISKYTDAGQDFSFIADFGKDLDEFCENIYEYYKEFDVDKEASLWIGDDGHGKNGAPYRISDIIKDMEQAKQYILDCYNLLKN